MDMERDYMLRGKMLVMKLAYKMLGFVLTRKRIAIIIEINRFCVTVL